MTGSRSNERVLIERDGLDARKVSAFPIGVDLREFNPGPPAYDLCAELGLTPSDRLVGIVSYLRSYKGHRYFVEAAAQVASRLTQVKF